MVFMENYLIMKTSLLLFCKVVLNFRNLAKFVWIDLIQIWKVFESLKKTEKEKKKERNKIGLDPGETI
jgi:hypothetical protein